MHSLAWSPWQILSGLSHVRSDALADTLDGGQAFRWRAEPEGTWRGQWLDHLVRIRATSSGTLEWQTPLNDTEGTGSALREYLALNIDFAAGIDQLPWRSDPALLSALQAFPGLRILRQPFGETLLGFLCSATKQIVQIRQMMDLLATRLGQPVIGDYYRLPTWSELADVSENELRACALGFRARHIYGVARHLREQPDWLEETARLPYPEAKERLCTLPGVGEKVADCVLLFGAGRLEAFPVDTWIIKVLAARYGCDGWKPAQIAHFGRVHFGAWAGFAQQFLFAQARQEAQAKRRTS